MGKVIGFAGLISSGKNTAADVLVNEFGFVQDSFASTLKDACSVIFGWDRTMLEGATKEAREEREKIDVWWSNRLGLPMSPRWALQNIGTDVFRNHFHADVWVSSLENKWQKSYNNVVISDVRFPNEVSTILKLGNVYRIRRGPDPEWFEVAKIATNSIHPSKDTAITAMNETYKVHQSEWAWAGSPFTDIIENDSTIEELRKKIRGLVNDSNS